MNYHQVYIYDQTNCVSRSFTDKTLASLLDNKEGHVNCIFFLIIIDIASENVWFQALHVGDDKLYTVTIKTKFCGIKYLISTRSD